jgi:hypothetical protein
MLGSVKSIAGRMLCDAGNQHGNREALYSADKHIALEIVRS